MGILLKRARANINSAEMKPIQREQRLRAVLVTWKSICTRRGLTRAQKDEIFEKYLIQTYELGLTARRDYRIMVDSMIKKRGPKGNL